MRCESVTSGRYVLFASGAKGVAVMVRGDACTWHWFGSAAEIERALIGCVCVGFVWLLGGVVRVLRRRDGTGRRLGVLFGRVDCAADILIVDGAVYSLYAAPSRRGVSRRDAFGLAARLWLLRGGDAGIGMGCGCCEGGEVCGWGRAGTADGA